MLDEALDFMEAASAPVIQRLAWNHPPHDPVRWQCRNWRWTARICSRMTGEILTSTCFNKACCLVFWNFWELWFVCFANSLTCGAKKMRRNHFFWGGVCPIPKLPEAIEFSRMPPDFFDSRNLLRFFFFCETWVVIRSHQHINISASVSKSQLRWEMSPFSESKLTLWGSYLSKGYL